MFKGFNMSVTKDEEKILIDKYLNVGENLYDKTKKQINTKLDSYIGVDGYMDCSRLQEDWFPTVLNHHIFLSHSHQDEELAISIAGWLYEKFGLEIFIDSCIWGYSDELLKKIDVKYSKIKNEGSDKDKNLEGNVYEYGKVKKTTSYIHTMLSTALNKMIDTTECVIFLNTDKSTLNTKDIISTKTQSAWIYSEINTTAVIREKTPTRYNEKLTHTDVIFNESLQKGFKPIFDLDLSHLISLDYSDFKSMEMANSIDNPEYILDKLYLAKKVIEKR